MSAERGEKRIDIKRWEGSLTPDTVNELKRIALGFQIPPTVNSAMDQLDRVVAHEQWPQFLGLWDKLNELNLGLHACRKLQEIIGDYSDSEGQYEQELYEQELIDRIKTAQGMADEIQGQIMQETKVTSEAILIGFRYSLLLEKATTQPQAK